MDNNGKNFSVIKMGVHNNYCHYEERSDEVIHSNTMYFLDCHENLRFSRNDKCICRPEVVSRSYLFNKDTILFPD